eukprot:1159051-Pelagomonas_calceolata.AAC.4
MSAFVVADNICCDIGCPGERERWKVQGHMGKGAVRVHEEHLEECVCVKDAWERCFMSTSDER